MTTSAERVAELEAQVLRLEDLVLQLSALNLVSQVAQDEVDIAPMAVRILDLVGQVVGLPDCAVVCRDGAEGRVFPARHASPGFAAEVGRTWADPSLMAPDLLVLPIRRGEEALGALAVRGAATVRGRVRDVLGLFARELGPLLERGLAVERVKAHYEEQLTFVRYLTHDLRTPLSAVLSTLMSLGNRALRFPPETTQNLIDGALANARQVDAMLADLLDFHRSQAGALEWRPEAVDVVRLVWDVATTLEPAAQAAGLALEVQTADDLPAARADQSLLGRVITNFLGNALKYTPTGRIRVRGASEGDAILIRVDDSGPGIPEAERRHVFMPFYRVAGGSPGLPGTGLGLAFCRRVAEEMGGSVWVESSDLGGATFGIALPRFDQDQERIRAES